MIFESLETLDRRITLVLNSLHFEAGDHFWQFFSSIGVWYPMYAAVLFVVVRRLGWKKGLTMTLAMVLTVLACDQLSGLVKDTVCRMRPCYDSFMITRGLHVLEARGSYYGFFSGHAANAFGFAAASGISLEMDKNHRYDTYQWFIFVWAALVGISRIFVGKHYFGDVLVGAVVGFAIGYAIASLFRRFATRLESSVPS